MKLKNKIVPKSDFQYSVNIDYDLNSEEKIKGYIPTIGGLNIIEDVMLSTVPNSKDRARLFVGAYGKGKSHLVLTILSLLSKKDKSLFTAVLNKAKEKNVEFYDFLNDYISSNKKLLPVVIQGSSSDTTQTFLLSLKNALVANGLESVLPDSYFSCAIDTINNWKTKYKTTYDSFVSAISEKVEIFIERLNRYDTEAYETFVRIYPELTSGSEFAPTKGLDVVKVYEDVAKKIKPYGFSGIYVVYDEFSKFLENSMGKTSAMEIKMIQDFAELCNRSGDNQLHLLLISHKHIQNYISQLPKEKIDAWKAVAERFKTVEIHNNFTQTYEIVSSVIQKDKKWFEEYKKEHRDDFTLIADSCEKIGLLSDLPEEVVKKLIYGTYPLDTSSLFILPRISELVAQNERTIFTFLASNQKNSLTDFINNVDDEFPLITPDYIYDYFEQLFKNENYNGVTYKTYFACKSAIAKLETKTNNRLTYKILKCIALILILQQQNNKLTPTIDTITKIYLPVEKSIEAINNAFKELKQYGVITLLDYNNFITINKGSDFDIPSLIENIMSKHKTTFDVKEELNKYIETNFLYPARYNDENAITRYFKTEFITDDEIFEVENWDKKISNIAADGVVYLVLENGNIGRIALKEKIESVDNSRIVFVKLNKKLNISKTLLKLKALDIIYNAANDNEKITIKDELNVYFEDCMKIVNEFVDSYLRPELQSAIFYNNGQEIKKVKRKSSVSQLLSDICERVFVYTPRINNELINKNNITAPLFNARNKVLNALLQNELKPNLGLTGSGPEINVMRATLFSTGIMSENSTDIRLEELTPNIQLIIDTIKKFFISNEGDNSFAKLYEKLVLPENGIGLKMGVIPVFIAAVLHNYKQHAVILNTSNKELEIKAETLENINKVPSAYKFVLEDWNSEKQEYINELDTLFRKNIVATEREYNTFDYIVKAMQRWFMNLSKYSREADQAYEGNLEFSKLKVQIKKFKNQLKGSDINSRELLFDKLPEIFGKQGKDLVKEIKRTKEVLDLMLVNTRSNLIEDTKRIFKGNENATLPSVLQDWLETLKEDTKNHLYNNSNEVIFNFIDTEKSDENALFEKIAKHLVGLRLTDWEDNSITYFVNSLTKFKEEVDEVNSKESSSTANANGNYKIIYVDENGKEEVRTLSKVEKSRQANLLNNDITSLLEDFGSSVTTNEIRQVLLEIFQNLK